MQLWVNLKDLYTGYSFPKRSVAIFSMYLYLKKVSDTLRILPTETNDQDKHRARRS